MLCMFYELKKRRNSAMLPVGSDEQYRADGQLVDDTSITHPAISIHAGADFPAPAKLNYARISTFERWYFVREWVYNAGVWTAYLDVDPLASWYLDFKDQQFYCLRCGARQYREPYLIDNVYPTSARAVTSWQYGSLDLSIRPNEVSYVVGILNKDPASIGATSYYVMTQAEFRKLTNYMTNTVDWMGIDTSEISTNLQKALINPLQYITSCMLFPFGRENFVVGPTSTGYMPVGPWSIPNISVNKLLSFITEMSFDIAIGTHPDSRAEPYDPEHPETWDPSPRKYLNAAPYTQITLYVPGFGAMPLDTQTLAGKDRLKFTLQVDLTTGAASIECEDKAALPGRPTGQLGIPVKLPQYTQDVVGVARGVSQATIGATTSALTLDVGGAISNAAAGIESAVKSAMPSVSTTGGNGSLLDITTPPYLEIKYQRPVQQNDDVLGVAVCKTLTPESIHSGVGTSKKRGSVYFMAANPQVEIPATTEEIDAINTLLAEGCYL